MGLRVAGTRDSASTVQAYFLLCLPECSWRTEHFPVAYAARTAPGVQVWRVLLHGQVQAGAMLVGGRG